MPEQNFDSWINGGATISFKLSENDVYSDKNTLVLYVLEEPVPVKLGDAGNYQTPDVFQNGKTFLIKPYLE